MHHAPTFHPDSKSARKETVTAAAYPGFASNCYSDPGYCICVVARNQNVTFRRFCTPRPKFVIKSEPNHSTENIPNAPPPPEPVLLLPLPVVGVVLAVPTATLNRIPSPALPPL